MHSRFWTFVEACDDAQTVRAVRDLLAEAVRALGFDTFAIATHAPLADLRSLGVFAHNWTDEAADCFQAGIRDGTANTLLDTAERTLQPLHWASGQWRQCLKSDERVWLERLAKLARGAGATMAIRTSLVGASCSVTAQSPLTTDRLKTCVRIAGYAFHQIQYLQQPVVSEADRLTIREHECLYRSAVYGERPSQVSRRLGVKVSTVRTLRQKANGRLEAENSEQAVWRMLETRQLFRRGRAGKPRSR